jgi:type IX secretion system PorP/SprF family membrane protein
MNNQLVINPAYAGTRNSLAADLTIRKQWLGIAGSPTTYLFSAHSPINKTRISLGGSLLSDKYGPVQTNQFTLTYSFLARINHGMFLSLGINGGGSQTTINLADLKVLQPGDPYFSNNVQNQFKPLVGAGAILFTQNFRISLSVPQLFATNYKNSQNQGANFETKPHFYFNGDYVYPIKKKKSIKFSTFGRMTADTPSILEFYTQYNHSQTLGFGFLYSINHSVAGVINVGINNNLEVCYSFDYPIGKSAIYRQGSHEITLKYDYYKLYKKNKHRIFKKKKVDEEEMRSIRYF